MIRFARRLRAAMVAIAASLLAAGAVQADGFLDEVRVTGVQEDDLYVAGGRVRIDADVRGDVHAAGGRVRIGGQVAGDVSAAAGSATVAGTIGDDVRVGAGEVEIDAGIAGDLIVGAGSIEVAAGTSVGGEAMLMGGDVSLAGTVAGDLLIDGGDVTIAGTVAGNAEIEGGRIQILPGAGIAGDLVYRSPRELEIADGAAVEGRITRQEWQRERERERSGVASAAAWAGGGLGLAWLLGLIVAGAVLLFVIPDQLDGATRAMRDLAGRSLGYGLIVIFAAPAAILFCLVTVIGIPLALALAAAAAAALFLAYLTSAFRLGELGLRLVGRGDTGHRGWRLLSLAVALVVLAAVGWIPFVGWLVVFLALAWGLGGWTLLVLRARAGGALRPS